jgi:hypothetical protein
MKFSLQEMIRQTVGEAEMRVKTAAAAGAPMEESPEKKEDKKKRPPADSPDENSATQPQRNESDMHGSGGEKISSMYVEKLASATDYLNTHLWKVGGAPITSPTGVTKGPNTLETNVESPTPGKQVSPGGGSKGKAIPMSSASDVKSPGQTNAATAMLTDMNDRPGGDTDWRTTEPMSEKTQLKVAQVMAKLGYSEPAAQTFRERAGFRTRRKKKVLKHGRSGATNPGAPYNHPQQQAAPKPKPAASAKTTAKAEAGAAKTEAGAAKGAVSRVGKFLRSTAGTAAHGGGRFGTAARAAGATLAVGGAMGGGYKAYKAMTGKKKAASAKYAADSENAASMLAAHHENMPPFSQAEEKVPSLPSTASKQEKLIMDIKRAISYTKNDAKSVPKAQMSEVLTEPAQRKATDPVLQENLDCAKAPGATKLSSVQKVAAAKTLLRKIAEEGAAPDASPEQKEKADKLKAMILSKKEGPDSKEKEKESMWGDNENQPLGGGY